ncbi:MAG: hypothetical protein ABUL62_14575 [Myxococcales bacterium]
MAQRVLVTCAGLLLAGCDRGSKRTSPAPAPAGSASAMPATPPAPAVRAPTRLLTLPSSAYAASVAMDEDAVYLMTSNAAYRLVDGEPAHGIRLELGVGPVLTQTAFVFWSNGVIWSAPKQGGVTRELGKFSHQPQYFVSSGDKVAWVDETDEGLYTIQTLNGREPRILTSSAGEIRALDMVGDAVYFAQRPTDGTWRIGVVRLNGGAPEYGSTQKGRVPSQLVGSDAVYYYDLDKSRVIKLSLDLSHEEVQLSDLVCSPIHVSNRIYCGCVEGLFDVSKDAHQPRVLSYNRPGTITSITSTEKAVAWVVDLGRDGLAVDFLPASEAAGPAPVP